MFHVSPTMVVMVLSGAWWRQRIVPTVPCCIWCLPDETFWVYSVYICVVLGGGEQSLKPSQTKKIAFPPVISDSLL